MIEIIGYEGRFAVNDYGIIYSLPRKVSRRDKSFHELKGMVKKQRINKYGYATVYLSINKIYRHHFVHVLVATHFIGQKPTPKHQVNHKDGNKLNNHVSNLEWVTPGQNLKHAYKNGLMSQKGEHHASHKLNNEKVIEIFKSTDIYRVIAVKYNISQANVGLIKNKKAWKHITNYL